MEDLTFSFISSPPPHHSYSIPKTYFDSPFPLLLGWVWSGADSAHYIRYSEIPLQPVNYNDSEKIFLSFILFHVSSLSD